MESAASILIASRGSEYMIRLPRLDTVEEAHCLSRYRSALEQRQFHFFGNESESHKAEIDAAFALGLTCGLELARMQATLSLEAVPNG